MNQCGGEILINFWFKIPLQILYLWGLSAGVELWSCFIPQVTLSAESHASAIFYYPFVSEKVLTSLKGYVVRVWENERTHYLQSMLLTIYMSLFFFLLLENRMLCQKMTDTQVLMDHFGHITLSPQAENACSLKYLSAGTYSILPKLKSYFLVNGAELNRIVTLIKPATTIL